VSEVGSLSGPSPWRTAGLPAALFALTVWSSFEAGAAFAATAPGGTWLARWASGWTFAVPLLAILLCHELGHYLMARHHRVAASLPYFIPLPLVSPFGTMGAVILMRGRIRSARALLDIGAAGPLAGMVVAIVVMIVGLLHSPVLPRATANYVQEGNSLLYLFLKWITLGPIPATHDVVLHPTALAAWVGFLMTFLNLLPFAQLDGGHVAYALLGPRHDRLSRAMWLVPVVLFVANAVAFGKPVFEIAWAKGFAAVPDGTLATVVSATSVWLALVFLILLMRGTSGAVHPPVDDTVLDRPRRITAVLTLGLFVLLFMPAPLVQH